jgi:hypothetical protein
MKIKLPKRALDAQVKTCDFDEPISIRNFYKECLKALIFEGESFSGKRPFGNSGWEWNIYAALIREGFVEGTLDKDGYVDEIDSTRDVDLALVDLIEGEF